MKFLVDQLPSNCGQCEYHAPAVVMSPLGVQKQVDLCTIKASLIPPTTPDQEPPVVDLELSPAMNNCPCSGKMEIIQTDEEINKSSKLILE